MIYNLTNSLPSVNAKNRIESASFRSQLRNNTLCPFKRSTSVVLQFEFSFKVSISASDDNSILFFFDFYGKNDGAVFFVAAVEVQVLLREILSR